MNYALGQESLGMFDVHVKSMPPQPCPDDGYIIKSTYRTIALAAATAGTIQLAPLVDGPDPNRLETIVMANDGAILLCSSYSDANNAANVGSQPTNPVGALIPTKTFVVFRDQTEVWVVNISNAVSRVTVITSHKVRI